MAQLLFLLVDFIGELAQKFDQQVMEVQGHVFHFQPDFPLGLEKVVLDIDTFRLVGEFHQYIVRGAQLLAEFVIQHFNRVLLPVVDQIAKLVADGHLSFP